MFLSQSQDLYCCGKNDQGQLGIGDSIEYCHEILKIPSIKNVIKIRSNEGSMAIDI